MIEGISGPTFTSNKKIVSICVPTLTSDGRSPGPDTKLMQNSGKTVFKRTSVDRLMNVLVLCVSVTATQLHPDMYRRC